MIGRPQNVDTEVYYMRYLSLATGEDLIQSLQKNLQESLEKIEKLSDAQLSYAYAEGKWSIGVLLQHLCDAERVYAYRALRFLRGDASNLPGFDEDAFAAKSLGYKSVQDFITEFSAIRKASIALFQHADLQYLDFEGRANNLTMSPRILGWLMVGHVLHHMQVLQERYL